MSNLWSKKPSFNIKKRPLPPHSPTFPSVGDTTLDWLGSHFEYKKSQLAENTKKSSQKSFDLSSVASSPASSPVRRTIGTTKRPAKVNSPVNKDRLVQTNTTLKKAKVLKLKEEDMINVSMKSLDITVNNIERKHKNCDSALHDFAFDHNHLLRAIADKTDQDDEQNHVETGGPQRVIKRLSVQQRATYVFNFLFSLPFAWALAAPLSERASLYDIETKAYDGKFSSTKEFIKDITQLIDNERLLISDASHFSYERLTAFKDIKVALRVVQEYFHSHEKLPSPAFTTKPKELIPSTESLSASTCYYFKVGDFPFLKRSNIDGALNVAMFHAFHRPIFDLINKNKGGYRWSISDAPLARFYIKSNRSKLTACSQNATSLCLVEVSLESMVFMLFVKPIGEHHAIIDKDCSDIDSPKAWIWAAILEILPFEKSVISGVCLHSPKSFKSANSKLQITVKNLITTFVNQGI